MSEAYIFWRVWEGVPDSNMYAFQWILEDSEIWSVTLHVLNDLLPNQGGN